ncbi:MAG: phage holin family protein [Limisphaerales bacterium]
MQGADPSPDSLGRATARVARRLLAIGGNRAQLLMVELAEERERMLQAALLAIGAAVLALLAGVAFTIGLAVLLWEHSPLLALAVLTLLYAGAAGVLIMRLRTLQAGWTLLPASLEQLRKDVAGLESRLEGEINRPRHPVLS